jgi:hypothetical protein
MRIVLAATTAVAILAAGCAPGDQDPETLSDEDIAALAAEHPRLTEEPLPEPQPNGDADPNDIPDHVQERLDDEVLERVTGGATFYADYFEVAARPAGSRSARTRWSRRTGPTRSAPWCASPTCAMTGAST